MSATSGPASKPDDSRPPHRRPEARRAEYLRNRKPRQCLVCESDLELGIRKRKCEPCRNTPDPRCKKCKKVRPLSAFSRDATRPSGYFPWCKDCQGTAAQNMAFQNPEAPLNGFICPVDDVPIRGHRNRRFCSLSCKGRASALRNDYGLTVEQYRAMVDAQNGRCPICQDRPTRWNVDHDHGDGRVMGPVCTNCNIGVLAYSRHDPAYLRRALEFLENSPAKKLGIEAYAPKPTPSSNLNNRWRYRGAKR